MNFLWWSIPLIAIASTLWSWSTIEGEGFRAHQFQSTMNFFWWSCPLIAIVFTIWSFRRMGIDRASSTNSSHEDACEPVRENEPWISSSLFKLYEPSPSDLTNMDLFFFHGLHSEGNSDVHLSTWRSGVASQEVWPQSWFPRKYPRA